MQVLSQSAGWELVLLGVTLRKQLRGPLAGGLRAGGVSDGWEEVTE